MALVNEDFETVVHEVVLLKGAVTSLEAPQLATCLDSLELHARRGNASGARAAFAFAQTLAERLLGELAPLVGQPTATMLTDETVLALPCTEE
jgi:hypothetical protein